MAVAAISGGGGSGSGAHCRQAEAMAEAEAEAVTLSATIFSQERCQVLSGQQRSNILWRFP